MPAQRRQKVDRLSLAFTILLTFFLICRVLHGDYAFAQDDKKSQSTSLQQLEEEKLRQEIQKLRLENKKADSIWALIASYSTLITACVAVVGVIATLMKQINETSRQRALDRNQRELDRKQREDESERRLDEKFASIVADLGSEKPAIQASASVSIMSFLRPEYKAFHNQVFLILLANVKIEHSETISKLLIDAFNKAARLAFENARERGVQLQLDISGGNLNHVDLSGLELSQADFGFARMRHANLSEANLFRVRGIGANLEKARLSGANLKEARFRRANLMEAHFHGANIVSARFEESNLMKAQFQQARLQSAHLENSKLVGAKFEQANLDDTYFYGASLNEKTLKSISKAFNWEKAHFDDDVKAKLEKLAEGDV